MIPPSFRLRCLLPSSQLLAKSYERESIVLGAGEIARAERVRLDRLQKAQEEEALAEEARLARQEDAEDEAFTNRLRTRSPVTKELVSGRILAAVPWTTARFKMSNALIADAFVELRGVDITGKAGGQDLDPGTGMTAVEMAEEVEQVSLRGGERGWDEDGRVVDFERGRGGGKKLTFLVVEGYWLLL